MVSASNAIFGAQRLAHRPADDLAAMQIQYGGEVKPAFAGGDVGQVGEPNLIGSLATKFGPSLLGAIGAARGLSARERRA